MTDGQPPKSPTLAPPRKSVELEDPGAHYLDSSNDEGDVFSDANDGRLSPNSPVQSAHTEKDLERDDLAVIAEGSHNEISTRFKCQERTDDKHVIPIPMTVVEKVDPEVVGHGDVPGTASYAKRRADAVPDAVFRASSPGDRSPIISPTKPSFQSTVPVPKTVVTKVDSKLRHGEVPGTDAYRIRTEDAAPDVVEEMGDVPSLPTSSHRSPITNHKKPQLLNKATSPIAEDGGFGPMTYDEEDDDSDQKEQAQPSERRYASGNSGLGNEEVEDKDGDDSASDFDEFEEGALTDDFGDDSNRIREAAEAGKPGLSDQAFQTPACSFPVLDFSNIHSQHEMIKACSPYLSILFPLASKPQELPPGTLPESKSVFLNDRSLSLWSQLVAPQPLQPPNWTRSRIRRLFLVSLGVPIDLDEILPASKQKKLVLPFTPSDTPNLKDSHEGSVSRLKHSDANASTNSIDSSAAPAGNKTKSNLRRRKGPPPPPEFDAVAIGQLCTTANTALENMSGEWLKMHLARLEEMTQRGQQVLQYWLRRKEAAIGDKEAFEGVIENLVRHARKVRK